MNFRPTSIAPQDVYKIQDKKFYWEKAKKRLRHVQKIL